MDSPLWTWTAFLCFSNGSYSVWWPLLQDLREGLTLPSDSYCLFLKINGMPFDTMSGRHSYRTLERHTILCTSEWWAISTGSRTCALYQQALNAQQMGAAAVRNELHTIILNCSSDVSTCFITWAFSKGELIGFWSSHYPTRLFLWTHGTTSAFQLTHQRRKMSSK